MKNALYPGSFDPITLGHINIIERALDIFDRLTVLIAVNPSKKSLFPLQEKIEMIREAAVQWPQVKVDQTSGLLVEYARANGITHAVRGLRALTDFDIEFSMALTNRELWAEFDTVFLMTSQEYMYLHSSVVRQVAEMGGDVNRFVPPGVAARLKSRFGR